MTDNHEVNVKVTFKNTEATDAIKGYAVEKVSSCIKKFVHKPTDAHIVLRVEKNRQIAELSFHTDGHDFTAKEESEDLYSSIDSLVSTVTQQLRKHKERLTQHH